MYCWRAFIPQKIFSDFSDLKVKLVDVSAVNAACSISNFSSVRKDSPDRLSLSFFLTFLFIAQTFAICFIDRFGKRAR